MNESPYLPVGRHNKLIMGPCEIRRLGQLILKSDWLFPEQYLSVFRVVSVSLLVQFTHFAFHVAFI